MGNVYSTGYNNGAAASPVMEKPQAMGGRVRIYVDNYTQGAADGTLGDVIYFRPLPAGARILPGGKMFFGTGNTSETLKVGTTDSDARFLAATAATTAGSAALEAHLASGAIYDVPAGGIGVIATNAGAAIKANQAITLFIPYVID